MIKTAIQLKAKIDNLNKVWKYLYYIIVTRRLDCG